MKKAFKNKLNHFGIIAVLALMLLGVGLMEFTSVPMPGTPLFKIYLVSNAVLLALTLSVTVGKLLRHSTIAIYIVLFFVFLPLLGFSFINLSLAAQAIFSFDPKTMWIALLLGPAVVSITSSTGVFESDEDDLEGVEDDPSDMSEPSESLSVKGPIHPEMFKLSAKSSWWEYFSTALYISIYLVLFVFALGFGTYVHGILAAILFEDAFISTENFIAGIATLGARLLPFALIGPLVVGGLYVLLAFGAAIRDSIHRRRHERANRQLSSWEVAYIESSADKVATYASSKKFPMFFGGAYWVGSLSGLLLCMAIWAGIPALVLGFIDPLFEAYRSQDSNLLIYKGGAGASLLIGIFTGIVAIAAAMQISYRFAPNLVEYAYLKGNWNSLSSEDPDIATFANKIGRFVRLGLLDPAKEFDVHRFLILAFREYEKLLYWIFGILTFLTFWFLSLDANHYHLFAKDRIIYSNYFSYLSHQLTYNDIQSINLRCYVFVDDGKAELNLSYIVVLPDQKEIDVIGSKTFSSDDLDKLERIDELVRAQGIPFKRVRYYGWPMADKIAYQDNCESEINTVYDSKTAQRVARLLRTSASLPTN